MYLWPIGISGNFEQGEGRGSRRACPPLVHRLLPNGLQRERAWEGDGDVEHRNGLSWKVSSRGEGS